MIVVEVIGSIVVVLFWGLVGLISAAVAAMCTPLRLSAAVDDLSFNETSDWSLARATGEFHVQWLFGLVAVSGVMRQGVPTRLTFRILGISFRGKADGRPKKPGRSPEKRRKGEARAEKRRRQSARRSPSFSLQDLPTLLAEARWLIAKLWRTLRFDARGNLIYGFDDPAATGACEAIKAVLPLPRQFQITPDFTEARLEGWAQIYLTVFPIHPLVVAVRALFRRGLRQMWWPALKGRISRVFH